MFEKFEILIIIVIILLIFYFVIAWGSGKKRNVAQSEEIKRFFTKNLMSDYAISSIKHEEQKKYSLLADIIVGIASVTLII